MAIDTIMFTIDKSPICGCSINANNINVFLLLLILVTNSQDYLKTLMNMDKHRASHYRAQICFKMHCPSPINEHITLFTSFQQQFITTFQMWNWFICFQRTSYIRLVLKNFNSLVYLSNSNPYTAQFKSGFSLVHPKA